MTTKGDVLEPASVPGFDMELLDQVMDSDRILSLLETYLGAVPFNGADTFLNQPVAISQSLADKGERLCQILNKAFVAIVENYFEDPRIARTYALDSALETILREAQGLPYRVGLYRPDFVIDRSGQFRICEVGCRYPVNGWLFSYYLNRIVQDQAPADRSWMATPGISEMMDRLASIWNETDLWWLHDAEKGTEGFYLEKELASRGISMHSIRPDELCMEEAQLTCRGKQVRQLLVEMDRTELPHIDPKVRKGMLESTLCLNDVRTLILLHDKRVLAVLFDREIMADYLSEEEHAFLQPFLIPSYSLAEPSQRESILAADTNWVLKRNSGGRGQDMFLRNETSSIEWNRKVTEDAQCYMVQEYIEQQAYTITRHDEALTIHLVAMQHCFNDHNLGFGIFRGSTESIINVSSGCGCFLPCVLRGETVQ